MRQCDNEVFETVSESQRLLDETINALTRRRQLSTLLFERVKTSPLAEGSFRGILEKSEARRKLADDELATKAIKNKHLLDEIFSGDTVDTEILSEASKIIAGMHDDLSKIQKDVSWMAISLQLIAKAEQAKIIPIVKKVSPTTSVQVSANGQPFLAIDNLTENTTNYDARLLLTDGTGLRRSEFNFKGILRFIQRHVTVFGAEEVVFQVLVKTKEETKVARKIVWQTSSETLSLEQCLDYSIFYIV